MAQETASPWKNRTVAPRPLGAGAYPLPLSEPPVQVPRLAQRSPLHPVRQMRGGLPLRGPHQGGELHPAAQELSVHRAVVRKKRLLLRGQLPHPGLGGAFASLVYHPGGQPLARGFAAGHLVDGRIRHPALQRPGIPHRRLGGRLRQNALPVSAPGPGRQAQPRRHFPGSWT
jgi:hypothetical protein